jgi:hypothetical protein
MRRKVRILGILGTIAFAFSLVAAANASAAHFQTNETGTVKGKALNTQTFTFSGGTAKCTTATTSGSVSEDGPAELKVSVAYSGCTAFGKEATVSTAELDLHASGTVDVLNTITVTVSGCTVKIGSQSGLKSVSYEDQESGKLIEKESLSNISYTSSGGICGSSGSTGSFSGNSELELNEGAGVLEVFVESGSLNKKKYINGTEGLGNCDMAKVGDVCKLEFIVTGGGSFWKVENHDFTGDTGDYTEVVGCTVGTKLEDNKAGDVRICTDTYTVKSFTKGHKAFSCLKWDPPEGAVKKIQYCTNLLM